MRTRFYIIIGLLFILAAGLMIYQPLLESWQKSHQKVVAINPPKQDAGQQGATKSNQMIQGDPVRIVIPSVNIDIPITNGYYNSKSQTWTLTLDKAQYAVI